jgi:hypothetical protein
VCPFTDVLADAGPDDRLDLVQGADMSKGTIAALAGIVGAGVLGAIAWWHPDNRRYQKMRSM